MARECLNLNKSKSKSVIFTLHLHSTWIKQDPLIFVPSIVCIWNQKPVEFDIQSLFYRKNKSNYTFLPREINNKISSTKQTVFHVEYCFKRVWAFKRIRFGLFAEIYLIRGVAIGGLNIIMSVITVRCLELWWKVMRCLNHSLKYFWIFPNVYIIQSLTSVFWAFKEYTKNHLISIVRNFKFLSFYCHTFQPILWWERQ